MANSSFQYWEHREKVRKIAGVDDGLITGVLWSADNSVVLPINPAILLEFKVPNNQALVITRFEGFMYPTALTFFPVPGCFSSSMTFVFTTVPPGLNPNQVRFSGAGNAIANNDVIFFFNSGETAQLLGFDPIGPSNANLVTTCYAWLIPGGKAGSFENYKTQGAG
jgi:hypothetical protein